MDVYKNRGEPPKSSILIGFSIIFTIHFGVPLFLETYIYNRPMDGMDNKKFWSTRWIQVAELRRFRNQSLVEDSCIFLVTYHGYDPQKTALNKSKYKGLYTHYKDSYEGLDDHTKGRHGKEFWSWRMGSQDGRKQWGSPPPIYISHLYTCHLEGVTQLQELGTY